jgi:hypothetical protein
MQRSRMVVAVSVVSLMLVASLAYGQTASPGAGQTGSPGASQPVTPANTPPPKEDKWEFMIAPYIWATQIDSKVTVKGHSAEMTTYFSDIVNNLNAGFLGHFEAAKGGKWGFFLDAIYLHLRGGGDVPTVRTTGLPSPPARDVTLTLQASIVEGGGFYRLGTWSLAGKPITVDALGGLRYWYFAVNLDTTSPLNPSGNDYWVDPFIGARAQFDLTKKLWFNLRGDVGGFGVGSTFSWNGAGFFGYRFTPALTGMLGYRALYVDYKKSTSAVRYEETFYGPIGGISYTF